MRETFNKTLLIGLLMWLIAAIFYGIVYLQHAIPSVLIKPVADSVGIDYVDVATIMSVFFPVYALSQIPAGYLIDRYNLKLTIASGCFIAGLGSLLMLVASPIAILFGRIIIAVGSAFAFVGTLKTVSMWFPKKYFPFFVGLTQTFGALGGGLSGQVLVNHFIGLMGWQKANLIVAAFALFWSAVILSFLRKNSGQSQIEKQVKLKRVDFTKIIKDKNLWCIAIYAGVMVGVVMGTFAELYDVVLLQKSLNITSQEATHITLFVFVGAGIGAPLHGIISTWTGRRIWVIICAIITCLVFMLMPLSLTGHLGKTTLILACFFLGFFESSMMLGFALARSHYPIQVHSTVFAFVNMIIGLAGFLFPLLFALTEKLAAHYIHFQNELLVPLLMLVIPLVVNVFLVFFIKPDQ